MTIPAQRASIKLLESHALPVRTHRQEVKGQELDPFTGKPKASQLARRALAMRRLRPKMPRWSKARGAF